MLSKSLRRCQSYSKWNMNEQTGARLLLCAVHYAAEWAPGVGLGWRRRPFSHCRFRTFVRIGQREKMRVSTNGKHLAPFSELLLIWKLRKEPHGSKICCCWFILPSHFYEFICLLIGSLIWFAEHLCCPDPVVVTEVMNCWAWFLFHME